MPTAKVFLGVEALCGPVLITTVCPLDDIKIGSERNKHEFQSKRAFDPCRLVSSM